MEQNKDQTSQQQQQNSNQQENQKKPEYENNEANYQLVEDQINNIQKEVAEQTELISDIKQLDTLQQTFIENEIYFQKLGNIKEQYPSYRQIRGDGQCFYRSYLFGIFERIVLYKDQKLLQKMTDLIKSSKEYLMKAGFEEYVIEDFQQTFLQKLEIVGDENAGLDQVLTIFLDKMTSDSMVMYARFMTSGYLKTNAILYENYILDYSGIDHYCQTEVDPIDREADQISMMALISYIEVPIKIVYLDQNVQFSNGQEMYIPEDSKPENVFIHVLYRPGHYDYLYPK